MSGIDNIVQKILDEADTQRESILSGAREEAAARKKQLEQKYEALRDSRRKEAGERAKQTYQRIIAGAMLDGRKMKLRARREAVDDTFAKAMERLAAIPEEQYVSVMTALVVPCLAEDGINEIIPSDSGILRDSDRLVNRIQEMAPDKSVALSTDTVVSKGGVVIRNGKVQSNLTFETLLRQEKNNLESEVMKILFEGSE